MARQYGALRVVRATGTTSFGTVNGALVVGVVLTHKSNVRMVCHVKQSTTGGSGNIQIPFDADFSATPSRKTTSIFVDDTGLGVTKKPYVVLSGVSGVAYVYYRNID